MAKAYDRDEGGAPGCAKMGYVGLPPESRRSSYFARQSAWGRFRTEIRTTNIRSSLNEMNVSLLMQAAAKAQVVAKKYQSAQNNFGHTPHLSFSDIL
jgi:hypothetical protein